MKLDEITVKKDEYYTPVYAVEPILEFIDKKSTVWCPFDTEHSNYVKILRDCGHNVIMSHIEEGLDFFSYEPDQYDLIISNPPYSEKGKVFERLFKLGKPFAMLVGVVGIFESQKRFNMFKENKFEIMYLNKRVAFYEDHFDQKPTLNPPFSSVYICKDMLPDRIIFKEISK